MSLDTPRDLFLHELSDMMSAEHIIQKMLTQVADEAEHPESKKAFSSHLKETQGHIDRLHKIFDLLGEKPEDTTCDAAAGLSKENDSLKEEKPEGLVKDLGLLFGAGKTEHYEIASYTMLATMAQQLGESEVQALLREILAEEEAAEKKVREIQRSLGSDVKSEEPSS